MIRGHKEHLLLEILYNIIQYYTILYNIIQYRLTHLPHGFRTYFIFGSSITPLSIMYVLVSGNEVFQLQALG